MLAALISSQTLVALVSAAPTPQFVVNLKQNFVDKHQANQAFQNGKCLIATDPKNACTDALTFKELEATLDFLAKHNFCKALTTKLTMRFAYGGKEFDNCPMDAYCYVRARQCAELTKANFPSLEYLSEIRSYCTRSTSDKSSIDGPTVRRNTANTALSGQQSGPSPARLQNIENSRILKLNGRVVEQTKDYIRIILEDDHDIRIYNDNYPKGERMKIRDRIRIRDGRTETYTYGRVEDEINGEVKIRLDGGQEIWLKLKRLDAFKSLFASGPPSRLQNIVNSRVAIRKANGKIDNGRVTESTKEYIRIRLEDDEQIRIYGENFANGERIRIVDGHGNTIYGRVYDERNGDVKIRMDDGREIWLKVRQ
jgi:hypothetical protein